MSLLSHYYNWVEFTEAFGIIYLAILIFDVQLSWLHNAGDAVFDASQYAFFGNDAVEEVELGGLEDDEDEIPQVGLADEEYQLDREEVFIIYNLNS